jgi:hypothetical protein
MYWIYGGQNFALRISKQYPLRFLITCSKPSTIGYTITYRVDTTLGKL